MKEEFTFKVTTASGYSYTYTGTEASLVRHLEANNTPRAAAEVAEATEAE